MLKDKVNIDNSEAKTNTKHSSNSSLITKMNEILIVIKSMYMLIAKNYFRTHSSSREEHILKFFHVNPHLPSAFGFNPQIFYANLKAVALLLGMRN